MLALDLPWQEARKTLLQPANLSRGTNSDGTIDVSRKSVLVLSQLAATMRMSEAEYSAAAAIVTAANNQPVLVKDPVDFHASAYVEYDGLGGWTQGVYIPGYGQYHGFLAKLYGIMSSPDQAIYIRPVAAATNITVYNRSGNSFSAKPATHNPDTQEVFINGQLNSGYNATQLAAGTGNTHPELSGQFQCYPAEFDFQQAYSIKTFSEVVSETPKVVIGCKGVRKVDVELHEVFVNSKAAWIRYDLVEAHNAA
jgi:hypothetical protein